LCLNEFILNILSIKLKKVFSVKHWAIFNCMAAIFTSCFLSNLRDPMQQLQHQP
jgi:hypothetical protein